MAGLGEARQGYKDDVERAETDSKKENTGMENARERDLRRKANEVWE